MTRIPRTTSHTIAPRGGRHSREQERPAEVNAALLDFLTRIDGTAEISLEHYAPIVY
jgi:hypothetical protein